MMFEHRDIEAREQVAQAVGLTGLGRLGDAEEHARDVRFEPSRLHRRQRANHLRQSFRRAAGFRSHDKPAGRQIEALKRAFERPAVEIVIEPRARSRALLLVRTARDVPACKLRQRLPAEARSAGAKKQDRFRAGRQRLQRRAGICDVARLVHDAQQWQRTRRMAGIERRNMCVGAAQPLAQLIARQSVRANAPVEAAFDRLNDRPCGVGTHMSGYIHCGPSSVHSDAGHLCGLDRFGAGAKGLHAFITPYLQPPLLATPISCQQACRRQ